MKLTTLVSLMALCLSPVNGQDATTEPGYDTCFTTLPSNSTFSFGTHYAVLNLDLITGLVGAINTTASGQLFISSIATWIAAVHAQSPPPLSIFTRIYFSNAYRPEIGPTTPFGITVASLGNATSESPQSQLYPSFVPSEMDVVLQKSRYYAGAGNGLEEILSSQRIDTVILSGIRTSGVILSTAYRLFDLNYNVYVITNNTIETPSDSPGIDAAIKQGILPKFPANVITLEQAIAALNRSGPAVY
ncbi:Isochorismatase-like protein [Calycina marina]|uniref:Isochorismatase-like protein n=1 Tax=Calycina marina TaxID=1763456 RepID=A0A9P7Z8I6_9HELO|nr:Isochorismatase-like protein [Calycina marina]